MRILYIDVTAGASGDMILGALVDAGAREDVIRAALEGLGVEGWELRFEEVKRCGLRALHAEVIAEGGVELRHLPEIRAIIEIP